MFSCRSGASPSTSRDTTVVSTPFSLRQVQLAVAAFVVALLAGAAAFRLTLPDGALQSFYRSTVTISLTGIDTKPGSTGGQITTIVLILAGMAIYGFLA